MSRAPKPREMLPSLHVFSSVLNTTQAFLKTITHSAQGWRRSIRSDLGCYQGSFKMTGTEAELLEVFYNWLGADLQERSGGVKTWRGLIYELDYVDGGSRWRRSLDTMRNYVQTTYVQPDGDVESTAVASNDRSIARYGRKENILLLDNLPQPAAEAFRDRDVAEHAWPAPFCVSVGGGRERYVEARAYGYGVTANWRFTTQITEYDSEQEKSPAIGFRKIGGVFVLTDEGQDFTDWQTTLGDAVYSAWCTTKENARFWAYLGLADTSTVANDSIYVYTDQNLATSGWNGGDPTGEALKAYYIRGPVSDWINDIITTDCEYLSVGGISQNLMQVSRMLVNSTRAWDAIQDAVDLGDTGGDPWRCFVNTERQVMYREIDTTPRYYRRGGSYYDAAGGRVAVNPWTVQPAVIRDLDSPLKRSEYLGWLTDARDAYAEEVEVDSRGDGTPIFKTALYEEGELLSRMAQYQAGLEGPGKNTWRPPAGYFGRFHELGDLPQYYTWQRGGYGSKRAAMRDYKRGGEGGLRPGGWQRPGG